MLIEPRNKILMKTIRMKDLETLKLSLPKPCYQLGGSPGSPSKHHMHQSSSPLEQNHLPNLSGVGLQGGGNLSSRSRQYPEVQASVNGASYSLDHVRVPSDRFHANDAPLRLGVPNKAKFIQLDSNFKRNLDAEGANVMRGKLNRNVDSTKGSGLNGLKSNINIQDPRNLSELPVVSNSHSVSKSPDGSRPNRLPMIPSKEVMDHKLPELSPDIAPQPKIQPPSGSEWVQAAQRIHPTKNHAAIKLKSVLQDLHQPGLDSLDRESLKSPSMGHDRLGFDNRPSSREKRHQSNIRDVQSHSNEPQRHKLSKLSLHGVLADERSKSFTHDHPEQPTSLLREAGEARNAQRRLSRKAHEHLQMIAQQTDTNARPPRLRLEAPIKANVSLNLHQHQMLKGNPKVFATQAQSSTIDLEEADIKTPTSQLPRFRQNVLASNLLSQKKSPEFAAGGSGAGLAKKLVPSQTVANQIDSLEQLVDQSKARRSIRLGSEHSSGPLAGGGRSEPREDGLVESPRSREALEAALALDIGPPENTMKRNSSKVNTTAFSHTQAVELNLD